MPARGYELDFAVTRLTSRLRRLELAVARRHLQAGGDTTYDPGGSGLSATDVQAAIDELQAEIDAIQAELDALELLVGGPVYVTIPFFIDGGGAVPGTGVLVWVGPIDFAGVIEAGTLLADQVGSAVVDVLASTLGAWNPPGNPDSGESITGAAPLTLSADNAVQDATLTGWTTSFTAGAVFAFELVSVATITRLEGALRVRRTS